MCPARITLAHLSVSSAINLPNSAGVIVIGNESKGIRPGVFERLTDKITINRIGQAESLNAAVAAGVILSHVI